MKLNTSTWNFIGQYWSIVTTCIGQITCTCTLLMNQSWIGRWKKYKWQAKQDITLKDGKADCFCTQAHSDWNMVILSHFSLDSEILQGIWQKLLKDVYNKLYFNWKYIITVIL